jgi:hypothetical protein
MAAAAEIAVINAAPLLRGWQRDAATKLERHRFTVLLVHRRAGKTVLACLWLLQQGLEHRDSVCAYIAPQRDQAKRIAMELLVRNAPPGTEVNRSELKLTLPNGTRIYLLGTDRDNGDSIRGMGIIAAVLDEVADIAPYAWEAVVRPALADTGEGRALIIGTPRGRVGLFWRLWQDGQKLPGWVTGRYTAEETGALPAQELAAMRREMSPAKYEQELLCSWDAATEGAYWATEVAEAVAAGRVARVPHDPAAPVILSMDLGYSDATSVWAWQLVGRELRALWWEEWQNVALPRVWSDIRAQHPTWNIGAVILPHDAEHHDLSNGRTRAGILAELGAKVVQAPNLPIRDGIEAVRTVLPQVYWDQEGCGEGLEYLRQYRAEYVENRQVYQLKPRHDFTSHAADSVRYFAVTWHAGLLGRPRKALDYSALDRLLT